MQICYNGIYKTSVERTHLKGEFISHALRTQKPSFFIHREEPNSLRWRISHLSISKAHRAKESYLSPHSLSSAQQFLFSIRYAFNPSLSNDAWIRAYRYNISPETERCFPISNRASQLPKPYLIEEILNKVFSKSIRGLLAASRQATFCYDPKAKTKNEFGLRFRLHRINRIWQTPRCQGWLQSLQKGKAILSSFSLLRRKIQRLLAWCPSFRRYTFINRCHRAYRNLSYQGSTYSWLYSYPWRCRLLRPQNNRSSRRAKKRLCNRSQGYKTDSKAPRRFSFQRICTQLRSSNIPLSASLLEKTTQVYSGKKASPRRTFTATNPFSIKQLRLPCSSQQSKAEAREHMAFLQPESRCRAHYQRTKGRLYADQNTNKIFFSQSSIFPNSIIRLQPDKLVQKALSSTRISQVHFEKSAPQAYSYSQRIGSFWKSLVFKASSKFCISKDFQLFSKTDSQAKNQHLINFLFFAS